MVKQNILSFLLAILLVFTTGFIFNTKAKEAEREEVVSTLNENLMKAKLEIGRAKTSFGNASKNVEKLETALKKDIEEKNSLVTRYGNLEARYNKLKNKRVNATVTIDEEVDLKTCDSLDLKEGQLYIVRDQQLGELAIFAGKYTDERIDISCSVIPEVTSSGSIPFDIAYTLTLSLKGEILETITPSGAINNYINIYEIDREGEVIGKLEINNFNMIIDDQRTPKFFWWSPRVDIGLGLGVKTSSSLTNISLEGSASLGLSLMSYGLSESDSLWRFNRLGLDIGEEISIGYTPALYNIGSDLPLFRNLWIGGFGHYGLKSKDKTLGLILGASL